MGPAVIRTRVRTRPDRLKMIILRVTRSILRANFGGMKIYYYASS
jgi:hypothetical protein